MASYPIRVKRADFFYDIRPTLLATGEALKLAEVGSIWVTVAATARQLQSLDASGASYWPA